MNRLLYSTAVFCCVVTLLLVCSTHVQGAQFHDSDPSVEQKALRQLYNSTAGGSWTSSRSWNVTAPDAAWNHCLAFGVCCVEDPSILHPGRPISFDPETRTCNVSGTVVGLFLFENNLRSKTFPVSVMNGLANLRFLSLNNNSITLSLSEDLVPASLPSLYWFNMAYNDVSGSLFVLANWNASVAIDLRGTNVSAAFSRDTVLPPKWVGLNLRDCQHVTGSLPLKWLKRAGELQRFDVRGTAMSGTLSGLTLHTNDPLVFESEHFRCPRPVVSDLASSDAEVTLSPSYYSYADCQCFSGYAGKAPTCYLAGNVTEQTALARLFNESGGVHWESTDGWNVTNPGWNYCTAYGICCVQNASSELSRLSFEAGSLGATNLTCNSTGDVVGILLFSNNLSANAFPTTILSAFSQLRFLSIRNNSFSFELTNTTVAGLSPLLTHFDIAENYVSGNLSALYGWNIPVAVDVADTAVSAAFTSSTPLPTQWSGLSVRNCANVTGTLPFEWLGSAANLEYFDESGSSLYGNGSTKGLVMNASAIVVDGDAGFECPKWQIANLSSPGAEAIVSPAYVGYANCSCLPNYNGTAPACYSLFNETERAVMIDVYNTMGGANWLNTEGWNVSDPSWNHCTAFGVCCSVDPSAITPESHIEWWMGNRTCNSTGQVVALGLFSQNVSATGFPASLTNVSALRYFSVRNNSMVSVNVSMATMSPFPASLFWLDLAENPGVTGSLLSLSAWNLALALDIAETNVSATFTPSTMLPTTWTALIIRGDRKITGSLPFAWLAANADLRFFDGMESGLHGPLSPSYFRINSTAQEWHFGDYVCPNVSVLHVASPHAELRIHPSYWNYSSCSCIPGFNGTLPFCAFVSDPVVGSALAELYNSTGGGNWTSNAGWNVTHAEWNYCLAHGVCCSGFTFPGQSCSIGGNVTGLMLPLNNLRGTIPPSIGNLRNLETIDLVDGNIGGELPTTLNQLTGLTELRLTWNNISGSLVNMTGLTALRYLDLGGNNLSGIVGNHTLPTNLQLLSLIANPGLTGVLPYEWIINTPSLVLFSVQGTAMHSQNDTDLAFDPKYPSKYSDGHYECPYLYVRGAAPTTQVVVDAYYFNYVGCSCFSGYNGIPPKCQQTLLGALLSFYNASTGAKWKVNSGWKDAMTAAIHRTATDDLSDVNPCEFYGVCCGQLEDYHLSNRTCDSSGPVVGLFLQENNLYGTLAPELANVTSLQHIYLSDNRLLGGLEDFVFGNLPNLTEFQVDKNAFQYGPHSSIGHCLLLENLNLGSNLIYGSLPAEIANLTRMEIFTASMNNFTGTIPSGYGAQWKQLNIFDISGNNVEGEIPPALFNQNTPMQLFSVGTNRLNGTIPATFATSKIGNFYVDNNELTGPLPSKFPTVMSQFLADENLFTGALPAGLNAYTAMQVFSVSGNNISATLTADASQFPPNLNHLDLSNNPGIGGYFPLGYAVADTMLRYLGIQNTGVRIATNDSGLIVLDKHHMSSYNGGEFLCPSASIKGANPGLVFSFDPSFYNYTSCVCGSGYDGIPPTCKSSHHRKHHFPVGAAVGGAFGLAALVGVIAYVVAMRRRRGQYYEIDSIQISDRAPYS